jgi:plastocyanin
MKAKVIGAWIAALGISISWAGATTVQAGPPTVVIEKDVLAFSPQEVSIKKGHTIRWINQDIQQHFLTGSKSTERSESMTTQEDLLLFKSLDPGETYEKAISDVGTFYYYCGIHNQMWGKITVEE